MHYQLRLEKHQIRKRFTCKWLQTGNRGGLALRQLQSAKECQQSQQIDLRWCFTVSRMKNSERSLAPDKKADLGQECLGDQL